MEATPKGETEFGPNRNMVSVGQYAPITFSMLGFFSHCAIGFAICLPIIPASQGIDAEVIEA
jgi:hypothetical protein